MLTRVQMFYDMFYVMLTKILSNVYDIYCVMSTKVLLNAYDMHSDLKFI